jgi:retinol dehydrogenase 12
MPKTILITGSTHGIGETAALVLAAQGHQVILHGRNEQRCKEVAQAIESQAGNGPVPYFVSNLANLQHVRELASLIKANFDRLDVLINNAGTFCMSRQANPDGFEMTWTVNHLSAFLLTLDLLELLKASAPARIVNVSSNSHFGARLDCDLLTGWAKGMYSGPKAYGRSKLANVLFTYELHRRLDEQGVTANALHPGLVRTNIWTHYGFLSRLIIPIINRRAIPLEEGAKTVVYLAASLEVEGVSGRFFTKCQAVDSSRESYRVSTARRLWEAGEKLLEKTPVLSDL